jgi:hypothetical protein
MDYVHPFMKNPYTSVVPDQDKYQQIVITGYTDDEYTRRRGKGGVSAHNLNKINKPIDYHYMYTNDENMRRGRGGLGISAQVR